jgi:hypothetical protein
MDLIYIILSVFLRVSPAVRRLSGVTSSSEKNRRDWVGLAFWFPLVGWVSVSVQHVPDAKWLFWRVREVRSFDFFTLNSDQQPRWRVDSKRDGGQRPPRPQSPDLTGASNRDVD